MKIYEGVEFKGNLFEPAYNDSNHKCMYDIFRFGLEHYPIRPPNYELPTCSSSELKITTN